MRYRPIKSGFTLIELLVVIAVIGVLAGAVIAMINPGAQLARARDADRKSDIRQLGLALESYAVLNNGSLPAEDYCDSSIGTANTACPIAPPQTGWSTTFGIGPALLKGGYLEKMPVDPINNGTYYYYYEPNVTVYWIGALLENPKDASSDYFRCSNDTALVAGIGCKEVAGLFL